MITVHEIGLEYWLKDNVSPGLLKIIEEMKATGTAAKQLKKELDGLGLGTGNSSALRSATDFVAKAAKSVNDAATNLGKAGVTLAQETQGFAGAMAGMTTGFQEAKKAADQAKEFGKAISQAMAALPAPDQVLRLTARVPETIRLGDGTSGPTITGYDTSRRGLPAISNTPGFAGPTVPGTNGLVPVGGRNVAPYASSMQFQGGSGGGGGLPPGLGAAANSGGWFAGVGAAVGKYLSHPIAKIGAGFGAYELGKGVYEQTEQYQRAVLNLRQLGTLTDEQILDAQNTAVALTGPNGSLKGVTQSEYLRQVLSLHRVFSNYDESKASAETASRLSYDMKILSPGATWTEADTKALDIVSERKGGGVDPEAMKRNLYAGAAAAIATNGGTMPRQLLSIIQSGSASVAGLDLQGFFGFMGALQSTMGKTNAGVGFMTAFNAENLGKTTTAAIEEQINLGIIDPKKVKFGKNGRPLVGSYLHGALKEEYNPFIGKPLEKFEHLNALLESKGFVTIGQKAEEAGRMLPRTAASEFIDILQNLPNLKRDIGVFNKAYDRDFGQGMLDKDVNGSVAGAAGDLKAKFEDLEIEIGKVVAEPLTDTMHQLALATGDLARDFRMISNAVGEIRGTGANAAGWFERNTGIKLDVTKVPALGGAVTLWNTLHGRTPDGNPITNYHPGDTTPDARRPMPGEQAPAFSLQAYHPGEDTNNDVVSLLRRIAAGIEAGHSINLDGRELGRTVTGIVNAAVSGPSTGYDRGNPRMRLMTAGTTTGV